MTAVEPDEDRELLGLDRPRRRTGRLAGIAAAVVILGAFVALLVVAKEPEQRSLLPGRLAPGAERPLPTLAGDTLRLTDLRAKKYVVLNFFASWCQPCLEEHPELMAFQQRHQEDATVVQVLFDDKPASARRFFEEHGDGGWPVLDDAAGRFALDYGVTKPPETYLIDRQGVILAAVKGGVNRAILEDALARAKQAQGGAP